MSIPYRERKWTDVDPGNSAKVVLKCQNSWSDCNDILIQFIEKMMELQDLTTWQEKFKAKFDGTSLWSNDAWMAKGGGPKKRFQYCFLNPNSSKRFLYFRAIQGHSGGTLVDPSLQDNVLLPDDFAEYIYHIGNAHDMHSIIQGGLIPEEKSQKGHAVSVFSQP